MVTVEFIGEKVLAKNQLLLLAGSAVTTSMGLAFIQATPTLLSNLELLRGWETAPVALYMVMTAISAWFSRFFSARIGESRYFIAGSGLVVLGALFAYLAIANQVYLLLAIAVVFVGFGLGTAQTYRFVGARAVVAPLRGRVLAAYTYSVLVAAVAAPSLSAVAIKMGGAAWGTWFSAFFLLLAVLATVLIFVIRSWAVFEVPHAQSSSLFSPLVASDRRWALIAGLVLAFAGAIMTLLMTASPLQMQVCGVTPLQVAFTFQGHFLAMFAPSLVTGVLLERLGLKICIGFGFAFNVIAAVTAYVANSYEAFFWSLLFCGIGWNLLFLSGQFIITNRMSESGKASFAGKSQAILTGGSGGAALLAAPTLSNFGWSSVAIGALSLTFVLGACLCVIYRFRASTYSGTPRH